MKGEDFRYRRLPVIDKKVLRLGLACSFGIDAAEEMAMFRKLGPLVKARGYNWI